MAAGCETGPPYRIRLRDDYFAGFDLDATAGGHGVACVDDEIDQHLFDLAGIGKDRGDVASQVCLEADVFADEASEHGLAAGDHGVEIDHAWVERLPAAEGQELPREGRCARDTGADLVQVITGSGVQRERLHRQFRVTADGSQDVVEIVGHTAGELADGFHALGVDELRVEL